MKFDEAAFFKAVVTHHIFRKTVSETAKKSLRSIINYWLKKNSDGGDARQLAYILATAWHETGHTLDPATEENLHYSKTQLMAKWPKKFNKDNVDEYVGHPDKIASHAYAGLNKNGSEESGEGWKYRGVGFVQLTSKGHFQRHGIAEAPGLAKDLNKATEILVDDMVGGKLTGRKLSQSFTTSRSGWLDARRIVNGRDRDVDIGAVAIRFYDSLVAAGFPANATEEKMRKGIDYSKYNVA